MSDRISFSCYLAKVHDNDMGNIITIDKDSLFLMTGRHSFKIPKSFEQGYNGSEVSLNVLAIEVLKLELT